RSCLMLAVQADGGTIVTAAGLTALAGPPDAENLTSLQLAFRAHHALQCGFCTPGILVATALFLRANPHPTRAEIVDHLSGHLCRCTGYVPIVAAIEAAAGAAP
ncbi:MAG: (2Fe-2S)-binding protein, partial [Bauldia sp.]|nr:(2Fe-2S)-binding protein [Bauldia sp.]